MPFCTADSLSNCHDANLNLAFNAAAAARLLQRDDRFHISVSDRVDCDGFRVSVSMADKTPVLRATFSRIADTDEPWPQPRYRFDFAAERSPALEQFKAALAACEPAMAPQRAAFQNGLTQAYLSHI